MRCLLLLVTALALTAAAEMSLTVEKLTEFIRSAVQMKSPDKQVAETLRHFKMAEKLDDRTIEELQSLGAGPKTVAALKDLGDASASLPEAAPPPPKPVVVPLDPPDSIEQARIIDEAREYVMNYTKSLPNFICVQVTRRDVDRGGTGSSWYRLDTITARLSYNGQHEDYEVITEKRSAGNQRQVGATRRDSLSRRIWQHDERDLRAAKPGAFLLGSLGDTAWPPHLRVRVRHRAGVFALPHERTGNRKGDRSGLSRAGLHRQRQPTA